MAEANKQRVWIQLAQVGLFKGHPQGPFRLDQDIFDSIVKNFTRDGLPIPIDAEHASEMPATSGSIPSSGAPAFGWIHALDNRAERGLWGLVEWLEPARTYIREGRYRFLSPAIRFKSKNRVTGEESGPRLSSCAITNSPFLPSMAALVARHAPDEAVFTCSLASAEETAIVCGAGSKCYSADEYMPRIKAALRLPDLATASECSDHMARLREHFAAAGGDAQGMSDGINLGDYMMPLRSLVNPPMGTTWEEVLQAIDDLIDEALGEPDEDDQVAASMSDAVESEINEDEDDDGDPSHEETQMTVKTKTDDQGSAVTPPVQEPAKPQPVAPQPPPATQQAMTMAETSFASLMLKNQSLEAENRRLGKENRELQDKLTLQDEENVASDVAMAFDVYKDTKGLTEDSKELLITMRRENPALFSGMYPRVPPSQAHLLRKFTSDGRDQTTTQPRPRAKEDSASDAQSGIHALSLRQQARIIARKEGIPLGQAQIKAQHIRRASQGQKTG